MLEVKRPSFIRHCWGPRMHHGTTSQCLCKCSAGEPCPLSTDQRLIVLPLSPSRCVYQALITVQGNISGEGGGGKRNSKETSRDFCSRGWAATQQNFLVQSEINISLWLTCLTIFLEINSSAPKKQKPYREQGQDPYRPKKPSQRTS